ncbi:ABC transporter ATP-binding protein [Natrarchaeobius oligotrophus]|uniref:ABC transporter ATP-binding protein n=1 Tax=Natrarchaeobius chitinivorans TaxID=1679083 RepID=A0A3N6M997_NATCH|nr:ABC transporter ATP-binding protein [Natrarchaeobius chitinivorans]RQG98977.1 ABC transporter ATP-binding protein [Natrarchaeobius chitinivorans]
MSSEPLLRVRDLHTEFRTEDGVVHAVDGVSYDVYPGEVFGVVGESGAGKSVTGLSILDLVQSPGRITDGEIYFDGRDMLSLSDDELRSVRGNDIAVIFQDALSALNPSFTVGTQIGDVIQNHTDATDEEALERTIDLLDRVGIPNAEERVHHFPHQLSGGMRQRVMIAMAISCEPDLIIADEPTTALDVTIQAEILSLLRELQRERDIAVQLITHNMGVVAQMCDRLGVMYAGKLVETGPVEDIFRNTNHPYTKGLLEAIPKIDDPRDRLPTIRGQMPDLIETPTGCSFHPRCPYDEPQCRTEEPPLGGVGEEHATACIRADELELRPEFSETTESESASVDRTGESADPLLEAEGVKKYFSTSSGWIDELLGRGEYIRAVDDVDLSIGRGETLGLVGESGCGKSTLGKTLAHLHEPDDGRILYAGNDLTEMNKRQLKTERSNIQVIFQDPFSSLNPRKTIEQIVGRPLEIHGLVDDEAEKKARVRELLDEVGLNESHLDRYPHEFSGGQKQRIGIARALAVEPDFIIADEPVSALDVSIQAKILNLLMDIQEEYDLSYLFIAHDLNVVQHISDRIAVMYLGEIVEIGTVDQLFNPPYHPYTEVLLSSIPRPVPGKESTRIEPEGDFPDPADPPSGCRFHSRCPHAMPECERTPPESKALDDGHLVSCLLFDEGVMADKEADVSDVIERQRKLREDLRADGVERADSGGGERVDSD